MDGFIDNCPVPPTPILWEESSDVYQPPMMPLRNFLSTIDLNLWDTHSDSPCLFIGKDAFEKMMRHAQSDLTQEQGGILIGQAYKEVNGRFYSMISRIIPALGADGSPTHLRFNAESWANIWRDLKLSDNNIMIGWYHTHPGLGVFMSGTDKRTQRLYFGNPWNIAIVIDPRAKEHGFFYGRDASPLTSVFGFDEIPVLDHAASQKLIIAQGVQNESQLPIQESNNDVSLPIRTQNGGSVEL